ncbi:MAG: hypothetical protein ABIO16_12170 [Nocardioides sp.]
MRPVVRIACDESGFVGGSLFGGIRVFAHASLRVEPDEAASLVDEVRRRTGAGADELKASRLNRPWAHDVAQWLCGRDGPLVGRAAVHVTDTRLFGLARLAQVCLLDDLPQGWWSADRDPGCWDLALSLHRGPTLDERFLESARDLLWVTRKARLRAVPESWPDVAARTSRLLATPAALRRLDAYLAAPPDTPLTEPLVPALAWALDHWSSRGDPDVVHDEQSVLTPARVEILGQVLAEQHPGRRLAGLVRVDSRLDERVQLADLVAGVVRRTVEDRVQGRGGTAIDVDHLLADASVLVAA